MKARNIMIIGGSPCSGKSTVAQRIAQELGAYYYKADDDLMSFISLAARNGMPACAACSTMTPDEIWMRSPVQQCDEEFQIYSEIAPYAFEALEQVSSNLIVAEGAIFTPEQFIHRNGYQYICITPSPEFQISHYRQREWVPVVLEDCRDQAQAFDNWMQRDILFARRVEEQCATSGIPCIVNDGGRSVDELYAQVLELFHMSMPKLETERMWLYPIGNSKMLEIITQEADPVMKQAYREMLDGCLANPCTRIWNTVWLMELKDAPGVIVGDFSFKGMSLEGMVEIGYGLREGYCKRGYMTEAVRAVTQWALKQDGVKHVEAETEVQNEASRQVLIRSGYRETGILGSEGPRYAYQEENNNNYNEKILNAFHTTIE